MITYSDREYKETKLIKQEKRKLNPQFSEISQWISTTYDVRVLNIVYDKANQLHAPRLQVILEHEEDTAKFSDSLFENSNKLDRNRTGEKFEDLAQQNGTTDYEFDGLFVVFSAFSRIAKEEVDSKVSDRSLKNFENSLKNPDLWKISRCFGNLTFFFNTENQAHHYRKKGMREQYSQGYFKLLKQHDEFNYLQESSYHVDFDSKENLDNNFEGNLFYYYR